VRSGAARGRYRGRDPLSCAAGRQGITLLGQIVDRYGKDIEDGPDLAGLLRVVHEIEGVERTVPDLASELLHGRPDADRGRLPKVMPHIEVPIQAGDDQVLLNMSVATHNETTGTS